MTGKVKFGIFLSNAFPTEKPTVDSIIRFSIKAEKLGFDSVWLGDHLLWHVPIFESLTLLSAIAIKTNRIKLGTSVLLLPLRNPIVLAKVLSTLDFISKGRIILGVGIGGEYKKEFEVCKVPLKERARIAEESIEILRKLWKETKANHHGKYWGFEDVKMKPKPLQQDGIPIWVGGRSEGALKRAAKFGDGWIGIFMTPERFSQSKQKILDYIKMFGRKSSTFTFAYFTYIYTSSDYTKCEKIAAKFLSTGYRMPFEPLKKYCILGDTQESVKRLEKYRDAGAELIILAPTATGYKINEQLKVFSEEIIPNF